MRFLIVEELVLVFILNKDFCGGLSENPSVLFFLLSKVYSKRNEFVILLFLEDNWCLLIFFFITCWIDCLFQNFFDIFRGFFLRGIYLCRNGFCFIHLDLFL